MKSASAMASASSSTPTDGCTKVNGWKTSAAAGVMSFSPPVIRTTDRIRMERRTVKVCISGRMARYTTESGS